MGGDGEGGGGGSEEACQVHFGNEPVSKRAHVVHAVGSVVNLLQEVFQLLYENALFEPLQQKEGKELTSRADFISTFNFTGFGRKNEKERVSSKHSEPNKLTVRFVCQPKMGRFISAGFLELQQNDS